MTIGRHRRLLAALGGLVGAATFVAPVALAQSGAVTFPPVTTVNVTDCSQSEPPLAGPAGGTVQLRGGQYINRNGTIYTTGSGHSCSIELGVLFVPAATDVSIAVKTFLPVPDEILFEYRGPAGLVSQQFTVPPQGTVTFHAQGEIGSVSIRTVRTGIPTNTWAFAITSIAIAQGPVDNSFVTFDSAVGPEDSKILISKAVWDVGYPSTFQLPPDGAGKPRINVSGTLRDRFSGRPMSGPVHLRIDDPPDPAPYRGADAAFGDNDGAASFNGGPTITVQTDSQGRFQTDLVVSNAIAGDNYQIVGATNAQFQCGGLPCARSPVFTLWKRIYVEEQRMFRRGTFVSDAVTPGSNEIRVADPTPFQGLAAGEMLRLVHAEAGRGEGFYSDLVVFDSLKQKGSDWFILTSKATLVPRQYGVAPNPNVPNSPFLNVIRDGVGVVSAGTYQAVSTYVEPLFASMFVELKPNPGAVTEVPFLEDVRIQTANYFASRWLQQGVRANAFSIGSKPDPNVLHRIAARQTPLVSGAPGSCHGAQVGITGVGGGGHYSYVFDQRIQDLSAGVVLDPTANCPPVGLEYKNAPASIVNGEVTAHETVHIWVRTAREPDLDGEGHCTRSRYIDATECLMHRPYVGPELFDGQVLLHYDMHGAHSEYMWIRRDPDPVPQQ